ncbi:MAG: YgeY family selenium metabolism-linked hydrolase, partial [Synergistaceae bacterium]|nr:YgeY family selenium metabolism-linked hydrolase [Synergistaceae bacterium]
QSPELSHYAFCTNGSYYAGKAGIPTVGYGGSMENLAHIVDEYIEIEQLVKACEGYCGIVKRLFRRRES